MQWKDVRALLEFKYDQAMKERRVQADVLGQLVLYLKKFEPTSSIHRPAPKRVVVMAFAAVAFTRHLAGAICSSG